MKDFTECAHERSEVRRRTHANGVEVATKQCLRCGSNRGCVSKASVRMDQLAAWDNDLADRWNQLRQDHWRWRQSQTEAAALEQNREWWNRYQDHLQSEYWAQIRARVLTRSKGMCEGCGVAPAVHVHHLTYVRLGCEMMFDLAAVCRSCHKRIHGREF